MEITLFLKLQPYLPGANELKSTTVRRIVIVPISKVHGAHLGLVGPRWAPCWPHEPCYQGCSGINRTNYLRSQLTRSELREKPGLQLHVKPPSVLVQLPAHGLVAGLTHSSKSADKTTLKYIICSMHEYIITSILKCVIKLLMYSQTSKLHR